MISELETENMDLTKSFFNQNFFLLEEFAIFQS